MAASSGNPTDVNVHIFGSPRAAMEHAAKTLLDTCREADPGPISVALSGGSTPRELYRLLASDRRARIPWERIEVFFGDERAVPPDHRDSNYRLAMDELLSRVPIPPERIHRAPADDPDLERAARAYEDDVRRRVPAGAGDVPAFHLIWLGMGEDGHTASLFPGAPELREERRLVVPTAAPHDGLRRITFTLPLLNAARRVQLLVLGSAKADRVRDAMRRARPGEDTVPAARVAPARGRLEWVLDRDAAAGIQGPDLIA